MPRLLRTWGWGALSIGVGIGGGGDWVAEPQAGWVVELPLLPIHPCMHRAVITVCS